MKKKALIGIFVAIIVIIGAIFAVTQLKGSTPEPAPDITPTPTAEPQPTVDNSATQSQVQNTIPPEVQSVIDANQADIFTDPNGELAPSYPSNLLPLYKVSGVADSSDITTNNGNPGWVAVYGSEADTQTIANFYRSLMASAENYTETPNGESVNLAGRLNGCDISVTVSPNNPQRTGLSYASDVNIFIEQTP